MSSETESATTRHSSSYPLMIGFVAGVVVASAIVLAARSGGLPSTTVSTIAGELEIDYMFETSPSEASGSTILVSRVEFHPHYVVATESTGRTHLWATSRLRRFTVTRAADRK